METTGKRVLVAEDDRFLRRACEMSLRQLGFTVLLAKDGEEALAIIASERPDVILLDLLMPKVNGLEVLRALKSAESTRSIPVLILTNSSRAQDVEEIRALGADGYQVKADLSLEALGNQVQKLLRGVNHGNEVAQHPPDRR
jgi:CheY-like chemotaxis protein